MAHLWVRDADDRWAVLPLAAGTWDLGGQPPVRCDESEGSPVRPARDSIVLATVGAGPSWYLVAGPESAVRINGEPLPTGIRALQDRDEIRVGPSLLFFSTERLAEVVPFDGAPETIYCPRCKQAILPPTPAVQCPGCGVWHHQTDPLPCWTYSPTCALCEQPTELGRGFRWTPEEL